jgi:hypothetical protein
MKKEAYPLSWFSFLRLIVFILLFPFAALEISLFGFIRIPCSIYWASHPLFFISPWENIFYFTLSALYAFLLIELIVFLSVKFLGKQFDNNFSKKMIGTIIGSYAATFSVAFISDGKETILYIMSGLILFLLKEYIVEKTKYIVDKIRLKFFKK